MNKRGFTITELLAVVVILGILTSLASVGVTRYRQDVKEKELINLHATIETGFDNYRSKVILSGDTVQNERDLCDESGELLFDITYSGKRLECNSNIDDVDIVEANVAVKRKGDLLEDVTDNEKYTEKRTTPEHYIEDGTCMIESERVEIIDENGVGTGEFELKKDCKKDVVSNKYISSNEEIICVYLKTGSEVLINDYEDEKSLCKYWTKPE